MVVTGMVVTATAAMLLVNNVVCMVEREGKMHTSLLLVPRINPNPHLPLRRRSLILRQ
jgi:hypothetical protein